MWIRVSCVCFNIYYMCVYVVIYVLCMCDMFVSTLLYVWHTCFYISKCIDVSYIRILCLLYVLYMLSMCVLCSICCYLGVYSCVRVLDVVIYVVLYDLCMCVCCYILDYGVLYVCVIRVLYGIIYVCSMFVICVYMVLIRV